MRTMKTVFLLLGLVATISLQAQTYSKGQKDLHLGIGLLSFYYGSGYNRIIPPINASFEVGITDNIGVGGFVGVSTAKSRYNSIFFTGDYGWRYTWITVGARGAYHFDILNDPKFDTYAGAMLGVHIVRSTFYSNDPLITSSGLSPSSNGGASWSFFGGCRYQFSDKLGVYGELGYGYSLLNVGLRLKLSGSSF